MSYQILKMESAERWKVLFKDEEKWLIGLYIPEFESKNEIDRLEKHDAHEFFHLLGGNIVLVLEEGKEIVEVPLSHSQAVIVNTWHNAYRPNGGLGIALVVERGDVRTKFKKMPFKL